MKLVTILALLGPLCACASTGSGIDYDATADTIALYRQDVLDVAYMADPETQVRVQQLGAAIQRVEEALRLADSGTAASAAAQAIALAESIALQLAPDSDVRFYIALAKIALRHVQAGQSGEVVAPGQLEAGASTKAQE